MRRICSDLRKHLLLGFLEGFDSGSLRAPFLLRVPFEGSFKGSIKHPERFRALGFWGFDAIEFQGIKWAHRHLGMDGVQGVVTGNGD